MMITQYKIGSLDRSTGSIKYVTPEIISGMTQIRKSTPHAHCQLYHIARYINNRPRIVRHFIFFLRLSFFISFFFVAYNTEIKSTFVLALVFFDIGQKGYG